MGRGWKARRQQGQRGSRRTSATPRCRRRVAIEAGLRRSGRTGGAPGAAAGRPLGRPRPGSPALRGKAAALGHQEAVGRDAQGGVVVALNAWLQPGFFGRASLESNIATFAPTILACVAQAIVVLSGELDLSLGAGVSLINCVLASLPTDAVGGPAGVAAVALALALALGAANGLLVAYAGLPSLVATFATGAVWFGLALAIMPQPGGEVAAALGDLYGTDLAGLPVPLLIVAVAMLGWGLLGRHRLRGGAGAGGRRPAPPLPARGPGGRPQPPADPP